MTAEAIERATAPPDVRTVAASGTIFGRPPFWMAALCATRARACEAAVTPTELVLTGLAEPSQIRGPGAGDCGTGAATVFPAPAARLADGAPRLTPQPA